MSLEVKSPHQILRQSAGETGSILSLLCSVPYNKVTLVISDIIPELRHKYSDKYASIQVSTISGTHPNELISKTLTRACVYLATWSDIVQDSGYIVHFFEGMAKQPKPWTNQSVIRAFPDANKKVKQRGVRDFDVGGLVGGHTPTSSGAVPTQRKIVTLVELENFSRELIKLEALLPLYLENI